MKNTTVSAKRRVLYISINDFFGDIMTDASNAGHGPNPFPREPMPLAVIENEQIFNAFQNSIANRVNHRIDEKLARRLTSNIAAIGLIASVLTAAGGYYLNLVVEKQVNLQVRELLNEESEKITQEAEFLPRAATLGIQLARLDAEDSVSNEEINQVTDEFEVLYSQFVTPGLTPQTNQNDSADVFDTETFQTAREREIQLANSFNLLVKVLSAINRLDEIEQLAELAPGLAQNSDTAFQALTQSYGRQIVGAAGAPSSWKAGAPFQETFLRYREWSSRARENGFPELYVLFESLIWHIEGLPSNDISQLIADINELNSNDGRAYETVLLSLANEAFIADPDASSARIKERTRSFITAYADTSPRIQRVAQQMSP